MNEQQYIQYLWQQYVSEKATKEEVRALFDHLQHTAHDEENAAFFEQALATLTPVSTTEPELQASLLASIAAQNPALKEKLAALAARPLMAADERQTRRPSLLRRYWAAASIVLALGIGAFLWTTNKKNPPPPATAAKTVDIAPGKDGAILTLADGTQMVLDSLGNGVIATQNGAKAVLKNGQLTYDTTGASTGETVYNTMSTPNGRQFNMSLPDGTKLWLNAASSIRYPTAFTGKERTVEVTGEVYFEVAKNKEMPFRVNVNHRMEVEVLGTQFNVNAYEDEKKLNTTLIEGSIKIMAGHQTQPGNSVVLKPGQQAQLANTPPSSGSVAGSFAVISDANLEKVMAWKNGYFSLDDCSLAELMRQVERWYNVTVVYEKGVPPKELFGKMNRDLTLIDFMEALKDWGVRFRLEGRKLIVTGAE